MTAPELDCAAAAPLLARRALGELSGGERERLSEHLRACASCREALESTVGAAAAGARARRAEAAEHDALRTAVRQRRALQGKADPRPWLRPGVLARILVPLGLLAILRIALEDTTRPGARLLVEGGTAVTSQGLVEPGTEQRLSEESAIRAETGARLVLERGAARAEGEHPLSLVHHAGPELSLTLEAGTLEVRGPARVRADAGLVLLAAGDRARIALVTGGLSAEALEGAPRVQSATVQRTLAPGDQVLLEL
ncbi:MAG: zf-HC2 domain-containing protein [Planctomycetes bacterium]|nr:zf-HC2 domain-containing protein [Planctomycetota bacterium]